ncbi:MAG: LysR family transcriptional regulator [Amphritea sp.]|nr:LysR family transcriptional regulator [Amphritea sp.]
MINPVFLRTFMNLVKTNHFTHTAEELSMTQPGVSQHIKKLEIQLGTTLLNRYGKKFELTTAGESLFQYGLKQFKAESDLLNTIASDDVNIGHCTLACSGSMAMQLYPKLLNLQKERSGLTVSVEAAPNTTIIELIKKNQSDFGIVTQQVNDPSLIQEPLGEDALCLVMPAQSEPTWEVLLELGFINHPDGHHYATQLLEKNFSGEFKGMDQLPQTGYINQLSQILLPVSMGLGFTVIPKSSLDVFPYPDRIRNAVLASLVNERVFLITKKHRALPSRYQLIRELLRSEWH